MGRIVKEKVSFEFHKGFENRGSGAVLFCVAHPHGFSGCQLAEGGGLGKARGQPHDSGPFGRIPPRTQKPR